MTQPHTPSTATYNTTTRRANIGLVLCMVAPLAAAVALSFCLPPFHASPLRFVLIGAFLLVCILSAVIGLTLWDVIENAELDVKNETMKPCATPGCTRNVFFNPSTKSYIHDGDDPLHCATELDGVPAPAN